MDFELTSSLRKTNILGQDVVAPPAITINNYELKVVHHFTYLGSTIADNLSLEVEISTRIGRAASTLTRLTQSLEQQKADGAHAGGSAQRLRAKYTPARQ